MHGIFREVPIQSQYLVNRQCSILLIGDPYFVCLCELLVVGMCFNLQPRYNRDNVERQPGADPVALFTKILTIKKIVVSVKLRLKRVSQKYLR